jgi:hypothetical protein
MRRGQPLGLDELMIVNPGPTGADGRLYQLHGPGYAEAMRGLGHFFLGEDGTQYQVQGFGLSGWAESGSGRFFLGEDGTLYEVIR